MQDFPAPTSLFVQWLYLPFAEIMMSKNISLFIVDDDQDDQIFLIEALKEIEPSVRYFTALNGQEGLQKLQKNNIPFPSLIFLDLHMPKISGKQFLNAVNKDPSLKNIPVLIYSTSSESNEIEEMKRLGAKDYLVKQADYLVLLQQLKEIFRNILHL